MCKVRIKKRESTKYIVLTYFILLYFLWKFCLQQIYSSLLQIKESRYAHLNSLLSTNSLQLLTKLKSPCTTNTNRSIQLIMEPAKWQWTSNRAEDRLALLAWLLMYKQGAIWLLLTCMQNWLLIHTELPKWKLENNVLKQPENFNPIFTSFQ